MSIKKYDRNFKIEVIKRVKEKKQTTKEIADELGIHENTIYNWMGKLKKDGIYAFPGKGNLKPEEGEIRKLKKKIKDLEEENEILKKASAYFAKNLK